MPQFPIKILLRIDITDKKKEKIIETSGFVPREGEDPFEIKNNIRGKVVFFLWGITPIPY